MCNCDSVWRTVEEANSKCRGTINEHEEALDVIASENNIHFDQPWYQREKSLEDGAIEIKSSRNRCILKLKSARCDGLSPDADRAKWEIAYAITSPEGDEEESGIFEGTYTSGIEAGYGFAIAMERCKKRMLELADMAMLIEEDEPFEEETPILHEDGNLEHTFVREGWRAKVWVI